MNTNENNISKDIFRLLGVLIVAIFSVLFFFLKVWAKTDDSELRNAENSKENEALQVGYSHPDHPQHNEYLADMGIL